MTARAILRAVGEAALAAAAIGVGLVLAAATLLIAGMLIVVAIAATIWMALEAAIHVLMKPVDCSWLDLDDEHKIALDDE